MFPGMVNNRDFNLFNRDGLSINIQVKRTGIFTRSRAKTAREFRKIIGGVQALNGFLPAVAVNQIVPIRNNVSQGAAHMTKRNTAIHTAGGLVFQVIRLQR